MIERPETTPEYDTAADAVAELHADLMDAGIPSGDIADAFLAGVMNVARSSPGHWRAKLAACVEMLEK